MVKNVVNKNEYQETQFLYQRDDKFYYQLNIIVDTVESYYICLSEVYDHVPDYDEHKQLFSDYLSKCKKHKIEELNQYDKSANVNCFYINGIEAWLDKATRVGLSNSISMEKSVGFEETVLYLNGIELSIPVDKALEMLVALEMYALNCYRQTEKHRANIQSLDAIKDVEEYDITTGYPDKLSLSI